MCSVGVPLHLGSLHHTTPTPHPGRESAGTGGAVHSQATHRASKAHNRTRLPTLPPTLAILSSSASITLLNTGATVSTAVVCRGSRGVCGVAYTIQGLQKRAGGGGGGGISARCVVQGETPGTSPSAPRLHNPADQAGLHGGLGQRQPAGRQGDADANPMPARSTQVCRHGSPTGPHPPAPRPVRRPALAQQWVAGEAAESSGTGAPPAGSQRWPVGRLVGAGMLLLQVMAGLTVRPGPALPGTMQPPAPNLA